MLSFRPLKAEEVECRVAQCSEKGASLLLYKTSRTDMDLLDETVGAENWQKDYTTIDGKLFCGIGVKCDGEWIWKWDTGTPSNMEAQKGEASDAAKRAGFCWGIGRELYTAPFIWVGADKCRRLKMNQKSGRWQCYDDFRVTELVVNDGRIDSLQICNASNRMAVVYGRQEAADGPRAEEPAQDAVKEVKRRLWAAINRYAELRGEDPNAIADGMTHASGYVETVEYLERKAYEFEEACNA
ncbi:MAG: hypothetical protein IKO55_01725 [Kiritimatiellae bacterium]|nr:hypothetical protein [Kiritimatiellia bacterium]